MTKPKGARFRVLPEIEANEDKDFIVLEVSTDLLDWFAEQARINASLFTKAEKKRPGNLHVAMHLYVEAKRQPHHPTLLGRNIGLPAKKPTKTRRR